MISFLPTTGSESEWNAAYYRLEDYLRALHVVNRAQQSQIILRLMQAAAAKHARDTSRNPVELVMAEADSALEQWFAQILPDERRADVMGYVALHITDGLEKWPTAFLEDDVPVEFQRAMRENDTQAGPALEISSMVPRPIDVPLVENFFADAPAKSQKGTVLLASVAVMLIATLAVLFLLH